MAAAPIEDWKPHLGRKVSVRYRLHGSTHPFSETVGVVASVTTDATGDQTIAILGRSGASTVVARSDILAAKLYPI